MAKWFFNVSALLMAVVIVCSLARADDNSKPYIPTRPLPQDADNNGIYDVLDQEIAYMIASGKGDDIVSVEVMLACEPSDLELEAFAGAGGNVTAGPWKDATYGFAGEIQYDKISTFAQNCQSLVFIEKVTSGHIDPQWPIPTPEYSAYILVFVMMGTVFFIIAAKKIARALNINDSDVA
jgi:hypothetical protein